MCSDGPRARARQLAIGVQRGTDGLFEAVGDGVRGDVGCIPTFGVARIAVEAQLAAIQAEFQRVDGLPDEARGHVALRSNGESVGAVEQPVCQTRADRSFDLRVDDKIVR